MQFLGLDIGGANIKLALRQGDKIVEAKSYPFALWKHPTELASKLQEIVASYSHVECIAATMTGELCDCYESKSEGVDSIILALDLAAQGKPIRWWSTKGQFVGASTARKNWLETAAANWSAAAYWLGRCFPQDRLLWLDIGSTTTDIIPIVQGIPVTQGKTDPTRMEHGELVYAGVRRTPLCAIMGLEGAAEFFATTDDLFGALGEIPERPDDLDTADGKPRTQAFRLNRLARMLGGDRQTNNDEEILALAQRLKDRLIARVRTSIEKLEQKLPGPFQRLVVSGSGEFFARQILENNFGNKIPRIDMSRLLGPEESGCLPAVALAQMLHMESC